MSHSAQRSHQQRTSVVQRGLHCTGSVDTSHNKKSVNQLNVPPALNKTKTDTSNAVQQNSTGQQVTSTWESSAVTQSTDAMPTATCSEASLVPLNSGNERSAIVRCTDAKLASPLSAGLQEHQTWYITICQSQHYIKSCSKHS